MKSSLNKLKSRFRAYGHVIKANIYNKVGSITYPYAAHFIPTWRCNLKCKICNVWKMPVKRELSTKAMLEVIKQLKSLDVIKIVGGEPFLRKDLDILVDTIRKKINPLIIQIGTNGVLTDEILGFAESVGYEAIHFRLSIDGIGQTHDIMRGVDGAFSKVYSTLNGLVKSRERKKFVLGVNFNVTDDTLGDMDDVIKLCNDLKVDFIPGIPVTPFIEDIDTIAPNHKVIRFTNKTMFQEKYKKGIITKRCGLNYVEGLFLRKTNDGIFNKLISKNINLKFPCRELRNLIYLHPTGDIVTCGLNHKKVDSLLEKSLQEIWFGKTIRRFRQEVDECPGCFQSAVEILSRLYYYR